MTQACAACQTAAPGESRWKGVAIFVGAILFCPCHLPLTITGITAIGGLAWLAGSAALLYLAFGVTYLFVIGFGIRYLMRSRDTERQRQDLHSAHTQPAPS